MNAEQVVQKILAEAKAEAEQIVNDAKAKATEQGTQLDAQIAEFDVKTDELAKAAAEDKLQRMLANARSMKRPSCAMPRPNITTE